MNNTSLDLLFLYTYIPSQTDPLLNGTQRTFIASVPQVPSNHNKIPKSQVYLDSRIKSFFPDTLGRKITVEEYQKRQLQHNRTSEEIEFYDQHGSPVTYRNQHDDNPSDNCNEFYPSCCPQKNDNEVPPLHKDGVNLRLNCLSNDSTPTTIQSATECFELGRTVNQFRLL